jgi:hypothetical protein
MRLLLLLRRSRYHSRTRKVDPHRNPLKAFFGFLSTLEFCLAFSTSGFPEKRFSNASLFSCVAFSCFLPTTEVPSQTCRARARWALAHSVSRTF